MYRHHYKHPMRIHCVEINSSQIVEVVETPLFYEDGLGLRHILLKEGDMVCSHRELKADTSGLISLGNAGDCRNFLRLQPQHRLRFVRGESFHGGLILDGHGGLSSEDYVVEVAE